MRMETTLAGVRREPDTDAQVNSPNAETHDLTLWEIVDRAIAITQAHEARGGPPNTVTSTNPEL